MIKFHFSTCVDEALLCKGIPLCENKNDLKACKMNAPTKDWIPINGQVTCLPIDHPEYIMPYGQTISRDLIIDESQFYCLNRNDTNPFFIINTSSNGTEDEQKTWTQWMNTSCNYRTERRCLGFRPEICVEAISKY